MLSRVFKKKVREKWKRGESGGGRAGQEGNGRTEKRMEKRKKSKSRVCLVSHSDF